MTPHKLLDGVLYVGVDEERIHFRVNVFNGNLEAVEATRLWKLHLLTEVAHLVRAVSLGFGCHKEKKNLIKGLKILK